MFKEIIRNEEFQKLANIGGHKVYHLEGNALIHTLNVVAEASVEFNNDPLMVKVAMLHDIGKIYTSIKHGDDDWEYPDHAMCGSFRGILSKFIPESDPDFKVVQWYIRNHTKPLHWMGVNNIWYEYEKVLSKKPDERCTLNGLARFAMCDVRGSKPMEPQTELLEFLNKIAKQ